MRSPGGVRRQAGSAFWAASTARATAAAGDSGAVDSTSPVAGLWTAMPRRVGTLPAATDEIQERSLFNHG